VIYLDAAATTLIKPAAVSKAAAMAIGTLASPGRGGHGPAMLAAETAYECRARAARLFNVENPESVVFTFNATHGMNIAINSLVKTGSRVVISGYEHNAVTRPLKAVGASLRVIRTPLFRPDDFLLSLSKELKHGADAVICTYVSNVFGYVLPIPEIAKMCLEYSVPLIIDASQSAGCIPLDAKELNAAFIVMPGHKGLYGPQGTGLLICGDVPKPYMFGGTGSASLYPDMPAYLPDMLEAGTHNMPGIAGLNEGLKFVAAKGEGRILSHERKLISHAEVLLAELPGVTVYGPGDSGCGSGVLSFTVRGYDPESVGTELSVRGISVRAGLHCSPLAHETAGTLPAGTIRLSVSAFNRGRDIDKLAAGLSAIIC